jgi:hypothetical protein
MPSLVLKMGRALGICFIALLLLSWCPASLATYDHHLWARVFWCIDSFIGDFKDAVTYTAKRLIIGETTVREFCRRRDWEHKTGPYRRRSKKKHPVMDDGHLDFLINYLKNVDCRRNG